jgi:hypothetical protein
VHEVHRPGFLSLNCRTPILRRTWAKIEGKGGSIGNNGDIVEVVGRLPDGLMLRDKDGGVGEVRWRRLEHKETGRLLVGFGHAMTVDAAQGTPRTNTSTPYPRHRRLDWFYGLHRGKPRPRHDLDDDLGRGDV